MKRYICLPVCFCLTVFSFCGCTNLLSKKLTKVDNTINGLEFYFIDVGQGDCIFMRTNDFSMMIDSGTSENAANIIKTLDGLHIKKIDYFVGTHPHDDHLGGAETVLKRYDIGTFFLNGEISTAYFFERLLNALETENIKYSVPYYNCRYQENGLEFKFISPVEKFNEQNNNSIVTKVIYGDVDALFMGDAEKDVEKYLIDNNINDIKANILKIAHHGSKYASTSQFLRAVHPDVCVIQSGAGNKYGHPDAETLQRIDDCGAKTMRCDKEGTIKLVTDGKNIYDAKGNELSKNKKTEKITYIGNKKSKIFHTSDCKNLPKGDNYIKLSSREEAVEKGFSPCGNCNP